MLSFPQHLLPPNILYVVHCCSLSRVWLFPTPWAAAPQASLSFTISRSLLKLTSIEEVLPSNHLILYHPFSSCPQSFPSSGSFPKSQFFVSGGQSIGTSAPVLPMNVQGWFPLGLTDLISCIFHLKNLVYQLSSLLDDQFHEGRAFRLFYSLLYFQEREQCPVCSGCLSHIC